MEQQKIANNLRVNHESQIYSLETSGNRSSMNQEIHQ